MTTKLRDRSHSSAGPAEHWLKRQPTRHYSGICQLNCRVKEIVNWTRSIIGPRSMWLFRGLVWVWTEGSKSFVKQWLIDSCGHELKKETVSLLVDFAALLQSKKFTYYLETLLSLCLAPSSSTRDPEPPTVAKRVTYYFHQRFYFPVSAL